VLPGPHAEITNAPSTHCANAPPTQAISEPLQGDEAVRVWKKAFFWIASAVPEVAVEVGEAAAVAEVEVDSVVAIWMAAWTSARTVCVKNAVVVQVLASSEVVSAASNATDVV